MRLPDFGRWTLQKLNRENMDINTYFTAIDTFSGWVEAWPVKQETASIVVRKLLQEILPRFGLLLQVGTDNGPAFTAQVTQGVSKALGIRWKLHCAYRPQSSGQIARMNRTLKETLTKLITETGQNWVDVLPLALLRVRCTPYMKGFSPFEIMFVVPPPLLPRIREEPHLLAERENLITSLLALQRFQDFIKPLLKDAFT